MISTTDWRSRAACRDRDPRHFDLDYLPRAGKGRREAAARACEGCPVDVKLACARSALAHRAEGVVVAGRAVDSRRDRIRLAQHIGDEDSRAASGRPRNESLHEISDCLTCGRTMRPVRALAEDYPGLVGRRSAVLCSGCDRRRLRSEAARAERASA